MVNVQRLLAIILLVPLFLFAQNTEQTLYVHGLISMPLADFGDDIGDGSKKMRRTGFNIGEFTGLAKLGYGLGVEFTVPVLTKGLGWQLSAKVVLNPTENSTLEKSFTEGWGSDTNKVTMDIGTWLNIPIFTGFSYGYKLADFLNVYGHIQAGLNVTQQPTREAFVNGERVEKSEFDLIPDFGMEAGLSFEILNSYMLGFRYLDLSNPRYAGVRTLNENYFKISNRVIEIGADERKISMFLITLGVKI